MNVISLVAGLGTRLSSSLEEPIPKALVSVGNETILGRQVRQLSGNTVADHVAVIGDQGDCWTTENQQKIRELVDGVVVNKQNAETEAAYSFLLGIESIPHDSPVLVIDGDIVIDDELLAALQRREGNDVALVRATESKANLNDGACIEFSEGNVAGCSFDIQTNYVYAGAMVLSPATVEDIAKLNVEEYAQEQLATVIDEIAKNRDLEAHTVNPRVKSIPEVAEPLDQYDGAGDTELEKRKGRITKRAIDGPKKIRDEIDRLQNLKSRYPDHYPEIMDISFFSNTPSYEMVDYSERGYTALDELVFQGDLNKDPEALAERAIRFIYEEFGDDVGPIPGLHRNTFLPKIRTRYGSVDAKHSRFLDVSHADQLVVNGVSIPGLPAVKQVLEDHVELLGRLEPEYMSTLHGDFKPDNILINEETEDFVLIDPRGRSEIGTVTGDSLYDLAKFLTSTEGNYTALVRGEFECSFSGQSIPEIRYQIQSRPAAYDRMTERVRKIVEESINTDPDWNVRLHALTGLLLISNAPVHVQEDEEMATIELVRGLELFEQALEAFESRVDQKGNVINVNTDADLELANTVYSQ